jgi:hypothetical protein
MWAHYANAHQGVCVGFDSSADIFGSAQQVKYSAERVPVDHLNDSPETKLDKSLLTKSIDWSYEEEWRCIDYKNGPGPGRVNPGAVRSVILGARMSDFKKNQLRDWIGGLPHRPRVFNARISESHFRIDLEEMP